MSTANSLFAVSAALAKLRSLTWKPPVPADCTTVPPSATALATGVAVAWLSCSALTVNGVLATRAVSVSWRKSALKATSTGLLASIKVLNLPSTSVQLAVVAKLSWPGSTDRAAAPLMLNWYS